MHRERKAKRSIRSMEMGREGVRNKRTDLRVGGEKKQGKAERVAKREE